MTDLGGNVQNSSVTPKVSSYREWLLGDVPVRVGVARVQVIGYGSDLLESKFDALNDALGGVPRKEKAAAIAHEEEERNLHL
jgi:hypothetical protein